MTETFEREMTISHSDFFRLLPKALKSYPYEQKDNVITISMQKGDRLKPVPSISSGTGLSLSPEGVIRIILSEQRHRQIGSLSLPVTDVTFQLKNVAENTKRDFFTQFDRAYQRGGG